jgi:hypothetical protein
MVVSMKRSKNGRSETHTVTSLGRPRSEFTEGLQDAQLRLRDVPTDLWDEAVLHVGYHSVGLLLNGTFIGSGTLISWGDEFGVLTAEHVTNNPYSRDLRCDFSGNSRQVLGLVIIAGPHPLTFEVRCLKHLSLGKRVSDEAGPDAAVIVLPKSPQLSTIKAKKSFWSLTDSTDFKMHAALPQAGAVVMGGHPQEEREPLSRLDPHSGAPAAFAAITVQTGYFEKDGFDYVEVQSGPGRESKPLGTYEGMSGGGLWRVRVHRKSQDDAGKLFFSLFLLGINFWQSAERNGSRTLRAHGPKTIYTCLLPKLMRGV